MKRRCEEKAWRGETRRDESRGEQRGGAEGRLQLEEHAPQHELPYLRVERGERVEAQFRGKPKNKFYKGKISKVNRDGTYDVKFDDGDRDRAVRAALEDPAACQMGRPRVRSAIGQEAHEVAKEQDQGEHVLGVVPQERIKEAAIPRAGIVEVPARDLGGLGVRILEE